MAILHLQRRLREVGRIRLGDSTPATSRSGKAVRRPRKLASFRLTSRDQRIIEAAAQAYGGEARPWDAPDGQQWEVVTASQEMAAVVPPGDMAFSQWLELWHGERCVRRCDGEREYLSDGPCVCDPERRECKTTSRLNVMLPEVPGFGLWRLETHGYYSAVELAGVVELCRQASAAGHMLPARLRLEQRQVKRFEGDKPVTHKFVVPVLDLDVSLSALGALSAGGAMPVTALADPSMEALPAASSPAGWSPVGELPEAPEVSVARQIAMAGEEPEAKPRRNAAVPIKRTGLVPRTAAERKEASFSEARARADERKAVTVDVIDTTVLPPDRALAKRARELGLDDEERHGLYVAITEGRASSGKDLTVEEVRLVFELFDAWDQVELSGSDGAWEVTLGELTRSGVDAAVAAAQQDPDPGPVGLPADWRAYVREHGRRMAEVVQFAQQAAADLGEEQPANLTALADASPELQHRVATFVRVGE